MRLRRRPKRAVRGVSSARVQEVFLGHLQDGLGVGAAAYEAGVYRARFYEERSRNEDFRRRWEWAIAEGSRARAQAREQDEPEGEPVSPEELEQYRALLRSIVPLEPVIGASSGPRSRPPEPPEEKPQASQTEEAGAVATTTTRTLSPGPPHVTLMLERRELSRELEEAGLLVDGRWHPPSPVELDAIEAKLRERLEVPVAMPERGQWQAWGTISPEARWEAATLLQVCAQLRES